MTGPTAVTWLFVPGSRPDRFDRAASSGADEVVLDLEDAVAPGAKDAARASVVDRLRGGGSGWVRVNAVGSPHHDADVDAVSGCAGLRGLVLPKAEDPDSLAEVRRRLPVDVGLLALVETAVGVDRARAMATGGVVDRLALGAVDLALDLGADETDEALLLARSTLVLASRLGGLPAPVDGVTAATGDDGAAREAAARARALGFGGKLCLHPRQLAPVREGFAPTAAQVAWAERVLEASRRHGEDVGEGPEPGVFALDGEMVDRPVLVRARAVLARAARTGPGPGA